MALEIPNAILAGATVRFLPEGTGSDFKVVATECVVTYLDLGTWRIDYPTQSPTLLGRNVAAVTGVDQPVVSPAEPAIAEGPTCCTISLTRVGPTSTIVTTCANGSLANLGWSVVFVQLVGNEKSGTTASVPTAAKKVK